MRMILEDSAVTVSRDFELSFTDCRLLTCAYLPIIGSDSLSLYFCLVFNANFNQHGGLRFGKDLSVLTGLSYEKLHEARRYLEACNLLNSYQKEDANGNAFLLVLELPKKPRFFFSDPVLSALLKNRIGNERFEKVRSLFPEKITPLKGFIDISESPDQVFVNDSLSSAKTTADKQIQSEDEGRSNVLMKEVDGILKENQLSIKVLGADADEVKSLAVFYGSDAQSLARAIIDSTSSDNLFIIDRFRRLIADRTTYARTLDETSAKDSFFGSSLAAQQFATMDSMSTPEFLARTLNLSKAPKALLDEAKKLHDEYGFPSGVINAIASYSIIKTGQVPSNVYIDKVAISLLPKHPQTAYQAALILKENQYEIGEKQKRSKKAQERLRAKAEAILAGEEVEENKKSAINEEENEHPKKDDSAEEARKSFEEMKKKMGL